MEIEKIADTVNMAIDEALKELDTTIDKIDYKVLQYPSKGLLGLFKKPARVVISLKDKTDYSSIKEEIKNDVIKENEVQESEINTEKLTNTINTKIADKTDNNHIEEDKTDDNHIEEDKTNAKSINTNAPSIATSFLEQVFDKMDIKIEINAKLNEKNALVIDLIGEDLGVIIGKRGQTLDSLQYLVNLIINKGEYSYMPIYLDTQDYRERRRQSLETLAVNLSKKARKLRQSVVLEPMNPYERRIIHAKLQSNPEVRTYSEGEEPFRYVVIAPK